MYADLRHCRGRSNDDGPVHRGVHPPITEYDDHIIRYDIVFVSGTQFGRSHARNDNYFRAQRRRFIIVVIIIIIYSYRPLICVM